VATINVTRGLIGKEDVSYGNGTFTRATSTGGTQNITKLSTGVEVFNVKDYGALGDGTTDDSTAMQAALTAGAGKRVYLPAATYIITTGLTIEDGTTVHGDGYSSILKASGATAFNGLNNTDTTNGDDDITIEDLTVDMDATTRSVTHDASCIRIESDTSNRCDRLQIRRVRAVNSPFSGIHVKNIKHSRIEDCLIDTPLRDGIVVYRNSEYVSLVGNIVVEAGDDCIGINSEVGATSSTVCKHISVVGGVYEQASGSTQGGGITITGGENITVTGAVVNFSQGAGIKVDDSTVSATVPLRVTVTGNTLYDNGSSASGAGGIHLTNADSAVVTGNVIENQYQHGIQLSNSKAHVSGNRIDAGTNTSGSGIYVGGASADGSVIEGNSIFNVQVHGINIAANGAHVANNLIWKCAAQNTAGTQAIKVDGAVDDVTVIGNRMIRDAAATNNANGISLSSTTTACYLHGNYTVGWGTAGVADGSSGTNTLSDNEELT